VPPVGRDAFEWIHRLYFQNPLKSTYHAGIPFRWSFLVFIFA
jgi:hypothetical protein